MLVSIRPVSTTGAINTEFCLKGIGYIFVILNSLSSNSGTIIVYVGDERTPWPSLWNSLDNPQYFSLYNLTRL